MTNAEPEPRTRCDGIDPYHHIVELRVHGVSGTPPEALLDRAEVRQVSGDTIAGFYRPAQGGQLRDHQPNTTGADSGPGLEAYSWGGITSGARSRALWLIFFPFALANVAPRMLPPTAASLATRPANASQGDWEHQATALPGVTPVHRLAHWLFRMLALSLTVSIVYGVTVIGVLFVGQACRLPGAPCPGLPGAVDRALGSAAPGWSQVAGLLIPTVLLAALWIISHLARRRYEEKPVPGAESQGQPGGKPLAPEDCRSPLLRPDLWMGTARIKRLRRVHARTGIATVAVLFWLSIGGSLADPVLWLSAALVAHAVVGANARPVGRGDPRWVIAENRIGWLVVLALLVCVGIDIADRWHTAPAAGDVAAAVQRLDDFWRGLYVAQAGLVVVILVCCVVLRRRSGVRDQPTRLWGIAAAVVGFLAWLSGLIITNAVILLSGAWLFVAGFSFTPGAISGLLDRHSGLFGDATLSGGYGMIVAVAALVLTAVGVAASLALQTRLDRRRIPDAGPGRGASTGPAAEPATDPTADDLRRVERIHRTGRLADRITAIVMPPVVLLVCYLVLQAIGYFARNLSGQPWTWLASLHVTHHDVNAPLVAFGALLTAGILALMIVVAMASYRSRSTRRGVSVLWDLACFWPRDVHPLAPPAYSERTVPELIGRLRSYQEARPPTAVVLAAHSQGTIVSAAALLAYPGVPSRVGLLTFGNVQARIYARVFPRYFNARTFESIAARCAAGAAAHDEVPDNASPATGLAGPRRTVGWVNLWRQSDFIGGRIVDPDWSAAGLPVPANLEERELTDPYPVAVPPYAVTHTPPLRHSAYWHDPGYFQALDDLIRAFAIDGDVCFPEPPGSASTAVPRTVL